MTARSKEPESELPHIAALDGVRGVAIILILLLHFMVTPLLEQQITPTLWIDRTVTRIASTGWAGVDLFFVLSGFLITRILLGARGGGSYFRSFYARRVLRIFPLYYGFLLFLIVLLPQMPGFRGDHGLAKLREHQLADWTYLSNVAVSLHPWVDRSAYVGQFWSLAVEEQFYLVWPAVVLLLGRRGLSAFCVLCIIVAPAFRYGLLHGAIPQMQNGFAAYMLMPARMDALAIGGLLAVVSGQADLLSKTARWAIPAGCAAMLSLAVLYLRYGGLDVFREQVQIFGYSALALTFAALLAIVVSGAPGTLQAACRNRVLTFFGRYSYGLYVFHFLIVLELIRVMNAHGGLRTVASSYLPFLVAFTVVGTAISVAMAWLSWHLYERHVLKLKRFVPYRRVSPGVSGPSSPGAVAGLGREG